MLYSEDYALYAGSSFIRALDRRKARFIKDHAVRSPDTVMLSLGSGDARKEALLSPFVREILAFDISEEATRLAKQMVSSKGIRNLRCERADVTSLELAPCRFDLVLASGLLHHFSRGLVLDLLRKAFLWLKPGGILLTYDPSSRRLVRHFRVFFREKYRRLHSDTERELDPDALIDDLGSAGFREIDIIYSDFFVEPLSWLFPGSPPVLISPSVWLDSMLVSLPGIKRFSSHFFIAAEKPA